MKLTGETTFFITIISITIAIIIGGIVLVSRPTQAFSRSTFLPKETSTKGSKNAQVYLIEFSDFQCPACRAYKPVIDQLIQKYPDKLIFGYRHFPLPQHTFAFNAAEVAEAAGEQGKFWEMYDYIFENQSKISTEFLEESGAAIGLDQEKFRKALSDGTYKNKTHKDLSDGKRFGVNSTPTFFLNGKKLEIRTFEDLKKAVEQEVQK